MIISEPRFLYNPHLVFPPFISFFPSFLPFLLIEVLMRLSVES